MVELTPLMPKRKLLDMIVDEFMKGTVKYSSLEEQGFPPKLLSKIIDGEWDPSYDELQLLVEYIITKSSLIPTDLTAMDFAQKTPNLVFAFNDEPVIQVVEKMVQYDLAEIPIQERETGKWLGLAIDRKILGCLLPQSGDYLLCEDLPSLQNTRIEEAMVLEHHVGIPYYSSLRTAAQMLMNFNTVPLMDDKRKMIGIITRRDLLKLILKN